MAGISRLQIDAATITPAAKPASARCTKSPSDLFIKNTHAEPSVVPIKGINIPKDLKIIGVDGTKQILGFVPELTTIQQPVKQIAKVAVDKLIDLIEGKTAESCMDLPVKLLEGQTT